MYSPKIAKDQRINSVFLWADNYWIMSHSKEHLEQMVEDLIEEAERCDAEPKFASLWCASTHAYEMKEDGTTSTRAGKHKILFEIFELSRTDARVLRRKMKNATKAWRRDVRKKESFAVWSAMPENGGTCLQCFFFWK